jgi:hypothetical protein
MVDTPGSKFQRHAFVVTESAVVRHDSGNASGLRRVNSVPMLAPSHAPYMQLGYHELHPILILQLRKVKARWQGCDLGSDLRPPCQLWFRRTRHRRFQ